MPWNTILALTDLSDASRAGLDLANRVARRFSGQVVVGYAHTRTGLLKEYTSAPQEAARLAAWVRDEDTRRLKSEAGRCLDALRLREVATVEAASAREGVEKLMDAVRPDAVVMATHGRTGMKHLLLGSVAEHTLRAARCPVLVTREGRFPPPDEPLRVLACLEIGEEAEETAQKAAAFAGDGDVLVLGHVVQSMYLSPAPYGAEFALPQPDVPRLVEASEGRLDRIASRLEAGPGEVVTIVRQGRPGASLIDLTEEMGADLVVLRTHARRGLARLCLGSVSEYVVRHSTRAAVLVYPPGA